MYFIFSALILILILLLILLLRNHLGKTSLREALMNDTSVDSKKRLIESDSYKAPPGYAVDAVEVVPGLELRSAVWQLDKSKGTILIFTGFTEFIEKYYETIGDLLARQWNVVIFDWRGQGLSSKLLKHKDKGYIENFNQFLQDADTIYTQKVTPMQEPHNLLGHSMGGHLALRTLQEHPDRYHRAVLSAPMQSIAGLPTGVMSKVAAFFRLIGLGQSYVIGGKDGDSNKTYERLTSDVSRFKKWSSIFQKEPRLLMGSATWAWSNAAAKSMSFSMKRKQIQKIKTPVYLASPKVDVVVDELTHERLDDINPRIKVVSYPEAKHEIYTESNVHRIRFIEEVDRFYSS